MSVDTFKADESTASLNTKDFYVEDIKTGPETGKSIPVSKLYKGVKDQVGVPISDENPLPVSLDATSLSALESVSVNNQFTGFSTELTLDLVKQALVEILAEVSNHTVNTGLNQPVTNTELRADPLSVTNQDLNDLTEALYHLTSVMNVFGAMKGPTGAMRIDGGGGVLTTVSVVGTLSAFGGSAAHPLIPTLTNSLAIQSNISNCTG